MLRDLLDSLRCPRAHDESWLVAMVHTADGPVLIDAELACPVCGAEFRIAEGVARFDVVVRAENAAPVGAMPIDSMRVAALLGVTESPLPVLLAGSYATAGAELGALVAAPQLWLNAPAAVATPPGPYSALEARECLPLGVETLAGAALDAEHTAPAMLASIVRAVRKDGRIVAPADTPLPTELEELARDECEWVAKVKTRASGLVELRRRAPDQMG